MQINWKTKSALYSVLGLVPSRCLYWVQRNITRRSQVKVDEVDPAWLFHAENIRGIAADSLIEFGAGKSLIQNLYLSTTAVDQTLVDLFEMVDLDQVNDAIDALRNIGVPVDGRPVSSLTDLAEIYRINYRAPVDMRRSPFPDDSFDICISTNTLEHIPPDDIRDICEELRRIVRPGGLVSARIDYSDHYAHTDRAITQLNFLRYSEDEWESYNHSNHYQNRLRHGHYRNLFEDAGLTLDSDSASGQETTVPSDLKAELLIDNSSDLSLSGQFRMSVPEV